MSTRDPFMGTSAPIMPPVPPIYWPQQYVPTPAYGFRFMADHCEHCWCLESNAHQPAPHERCCNCGTDRARESFEEKPGR